MRSVDHVFSRQGPPLTEQRISLDLRRTTLTVKDEMAKPEFKIETDVTQESGMWIVKASRACLRGHGKSMYISAVAQDSEAAKTLADTFQNLLAIESLKTDSF